MVVLAFSLQDQVEKYGAYVGIASFFGLAVLTLLYFAQAREVKRLREWAGRAPERAAEVEALAVAARPGGAAHARSRAARRSRPRRRRRPRRVPAAANGAVKLKPAEVAALAFAPRRGRARAAPAAARIPSRRPRSPPRRPPRWPPPAPPRTVRTHHREPTPRPVEDAAPAETNGHGTGDGAAAGHAAAARRPARAAGRAAAPARRAASAPRRQPPPRRPTAPPARRESSTRAVVLTAVLGVIVLGARRVRRHPPAQRRRRHRRRRAPTATVSPGHDADGRLHRHGRPRRPRPR